jgi:signal transduction histidine kinase
MAGAPRMATKLPLRVKVYAATLPLAAGLCFLWWWTPSPGGAGVISREWLLSSQLLLPALFATLAALAVLFPLPLSPGYLLTLDTVVNFAALLLFGPPVAMLTAGLGTAAANLALAAQGKRDRWNVAFNIGQKALAVGVAGGVLYGLLPRRAPFPLEGVESALAVSAAGALLYATTSLAVAVAVGLQRGQNPLVVAVRAWRTGLPDAATLLLGGLLTALLTAAHGWAVVVMALLAALVYVSLQRTLRLMAREQAARADLERAVQIRGEFLAVASHELRTPVASLRGYAQLLLRQCARPGGPDPAMLRRGLDTIERQSDKLTRLVAQLLDVSRLQAGTLILERQPTDLTHLAGTVVASMQGLTASPASPLVLHAAEAVWAVVDPLRLEQVLVNLLDNAIKYGVAEGPIEMEVTREAGAGGQETVRLSVRDRALPIPVEEREHVFERFRQLGGSRHVGGMGLGLYVSRQIVEAHGGTIAVEAPADAAGGNRFVITLPASAGSEDAGVVPVVPPAASHLRPAPDRRPQVAGSRADGGEALGAPGAPKALVTS